jgi:deazaflavin-dependent oxidoreductase (nitroreductase family)
MTEAASQRQTTGDLTGEGDDAHAAEVRDAAARHASKHRRNPFVRSATGGRVFSALMLPFVTTLPSAGYGVITTTGRKTGKARRKCIRAIRREDRVYIVMLRPPVIAMARPSAVSAWVRNIRANPNVRLRIRGGSLPLELRMDVTPRRIFGPKRQHTLWLGSGAKPVNELA